MTERVTEKKKEKKIRRNSLMSYALKSMQPYQFPRSLVKEIINELLEVYGHEGWGFIEEGFVQASSRNNSQ